MKLHNGSSATPIRTTAAAATASSLLQTAVSAQEYALSLSTLLFDTAAYHDGEEKGDKLTQRVVRPSSSVSPLRSNAVRSHEFE